MPACKQSCARVDQGKPTRRRYHQSEACGDGAKCRHIFGDLSRASGAVARIDHGRRNPARPSADVSVSPHGSTDAIRLVAIIATSNVKMRIDIFMMYESYLKTIKEAVGKLLPRTMR